MSRAQWSCRGMSVSRALWPCRDMSVSTALWPCRDMLGSTALWPGIEVWPTSECKYKPTTFEALIAMLIIQII